MIKKVLNSILGFQKKPDEEEKKEEIKKLIKKAQDNFKTSITFMSEEEKTKILENIKKYENKNPKPTKVIYDDMLRGDLHCLNFTINKMKEDINKKGILTKTRTSTFWSLIIVNVENDAELLNLAETVRKTRIIDFDTLDKVKPKIEFHIRETNKKDKKKAMLNEKIDETIDMLYKETDPKKIRELEERLDKLRDKFSEK